MDIYLFKTPDDSRVVHKRLNQKKHYTNVCLKGDVNVTSPVIELSGVNITDITQFNYMYIPDFGRYYFIDDISVSTGKIVYISARVDVLKTFAEDIEVSELLVSRYNTPTKKSKYLVDKNVPTDVRKQIISKEFGTELHNENNYFVLAVSSGVKKNI